MNNILLFFVIILIVGCEAKHKFKTKYTKNNKIWLGEWIREENFYNSSLEITKTKENFIEFTILASNGANFGNIDGALSIQYNNALYKYIDEYDSCEIEFSLHKNNLIKVNQKVGICETGAGVNYSGDYYKANTIIEKKQKENLIDLGVLKNKIQDETFKSLVGENYLLFVNSSQLTSEDDDLDNFGAKVYSSGVRGLYTQMENIIMINSLNDIWAAVINDNKVYYFTNRINYKNRLPKTIENWRFRFRDYEIFFLEQ